MFEFFANQKKFAQVFTIGLLVIGILALTSIQKDRFPNVDFEQMKIVVSYPNSSPEDVESEVIIPIEDEIKNISDIKSFTSRSREGSGSIDITINADAADPDKIKQEIRDAVASANDLPLEAENPQVIEIKTSRMEVLKIVIGGEMQYELLRETVNNIADELELLDEVAEIEIGGERESEVKIFLDPQKIKQYRLSVQTIASAITSRNYRYTAGDNNSNVNNKNVVVLAKFKDIEEAKNLILKSNFEGKVVRLKDVATITSGLEDRKTITTVNGVDGFILKVRKSEGADVIKTVDTIKLEMERITQNISGDVNIFYTDDLSKDVRNRLGIVTNNGIMGFILVLIILGAFLNMRTAFWVAIGMTITLLGTVAMLWFAGETINLISLAAIVLVLGIVVDDGIIVAESIQSAKEKDNSVFGVSMGVKKVIKPVITTIITSILAMGSMFLMEGTMGKFIYVIPVVVIFALALSFLEVTIALPAHMMSKKPYKSREWFKSVEVVFLGFIHKVLKLRYIVLIIALIFASFSFYFAAKHMDFNLFPTKGADTINTRFRVAVGSSVEQTAMFSSKLEQVIKAEIGKELDFISSEIGTSREHTGSIKIRLIPSDENRSSAQKIADNLKKATKDLAGFERIYFSIRRPGPPRGRDIEFEFVGDNNELRTLAVNTTEEILGDVEGVSSIRRDDRVGKEREQIVFDFEQMSILGVDFSNVKTYLKAAFSGVDITKVRIDGKDIDYKIFIGNEGQNTDVLQEMAISNKSGRLIPFSSFTSVKNIAGEVDLNHFNGKRSVQIGASVDDKLNSPAAVESLVLEQLDMDNNFPGIRVLSEGGSSDSKKSMLSFLKAFIAAIVGIYFLIAVLFNSWTQPLIIMTAIPFALIGVIWSFYFHLEPLSFFAIMGSLALIGVIVNDTLVLVSHLNDKKAEMSKDDNILEVVATGTRDRLRAVVLTSLTTLVGVIPLAYGIGGVDYFLQPMVLALGYGLLFGAIITLILLPCLYMINYESIKKFESIPFLKKFQ